MCEVDDYNFEKICRLCMSDQGPMFPLDDLANSSFSQGEFICRLDKICFSVCIKVEKNDNLPNQICEKCDITINDYYDFKETCSLANMKLQGLAKKRKKVPSAQPDMNVGSCSEPENSCKSSATVSQSSCPSIRVSSNLMPCSKQQDHSDTVSRSSNHVEESQDCSASVLSKDSFSEIMLYSVIVDNSANEDESAEESEDPLALEIEDLTNINNNVEYISKSISFSKNRPKISNAVSSLVKCSSDLCSDINVSDRIKIIRVPCISNVDQIRQRACQGNNTSSTSTIGTMEPLLPYNVKPIRCYAGKKSQNRTTGGALENVKPAPSVQCVVTNFLENTLLHIQSKSPPYESIPISKFTKLEVQNSTTCDRKPFLTRNKKRTTLVSLYSANSDDTMPTQVSSLENIPHQLRIKKEEKEVYPMEMIPRGCLECGETFETYSELVSHIEIHNAVVKEDLVSCNSCGKTFASQILLDSHIHVRHKNRFGNSTLCHICGIVLVGNRNITSHMNKHLDKREFLCDTCGAGYYNKGDLYYHIKLKHLEAGNPKLKCSLCNAELSSAGSMRRHMLLHTKGRTEKCPLCPKMFRIKAQVDRHMRSHTGETPYVCEVCNRGFTIKWNHTQHMRLHTKSKPYVCDVCGKAFTHNVTRRSHMKRHLKGGEFKEPIVIEEGKMFGRDQVHRATLDVSCDGKDSVN